MKTAVVILNWNGLKMLEAYLPVVVLHSGSSVDIIVIDNASADGSVEFIKEKFPDIELIQHKENLGFAGGYNEGLKQLEGRYHYYILLNSDVEVSENWIAPNIQFMDKNPSVAVCQPKIMSITNKKCFEHAGAAGGFIDIYGYPFCRGRIFQHVEEDTGQYDSNREIFWASGSCFFIRSTAFHTVGGFDADFFAHMEEIDLCWRLKAQGHNIIYISNTSVYHVGGGSLPRSNPQKTYLNFRNVLLMLLKNLPLKTLYPVLFVKLILDGIAGIKFLAEGDIKDFFAVIRAHKSFYSMFSAFKQKRKDGEQKEVSQIYQASIVFEHFVKRKKRFSQLNIKSPAS
ncbi:MAG: glycosyltransferase family 2 protein [Bacteroidetes bacterium]|nr:glycosyltransferase family 2 protein [Bacteroidota bacterium]